MRSNLIMAGAVACLCLAADASAINLTEVSPSRTESAAVAEPAPAPAPAPAQAQKKEQAPAAAETAAPAAPETPAAAAAAEPEDPARRETSYVAYISDKTKVWATRGPGKQYRLSGQLRTGEKVDVLSEKNGYVQVRTGKGTVVWVPKSETQREESNLYKVEKLEKENADLKYKLENIDNETAKAYRAASAELAKLKTANAELQRNYADAQAKLEETTRLKEELEGKFDTREQDMQLRWWKQGAIIALIGALAGVILVYLPRPRRKERDYYY